MNILTYLRLSVRNAALEFGASEEGATATEYVFLLVFIAIAIIAGATFLGGRINAGFSRAGNSVGTATGG